MKLWAVHYISSVYKEVLIGVFSSKEKADDFCLTIPDCGNTSILEMELDKGYPY